MTAEMRTQATLLAADLQRRRTEKTVRFTANTLFRVAIEMLFESFELAPGDRVNSEEELRKLVLERISGRRAKASTT
jgi:ribosomal protein L20